MGPVLPPHLGEKYSQEATLTIFQTVSEGGFCELRFDAVPRSSFGGRILCGLSYAHAFFEDVVDHCGMLRCFLANAQKALGDGEALG